MSLSKNAATFTEEAGRLLGDDLKTLVGMRQLQ